MWRKPRGFMIPGVEGGSVCAGPERRLVCRPVLAQRASAGKLRLETFVQQDSN